MKNQALETTQVILKCLAMYICTVLYLFIAFPIATSISLTIGGLLFDPLSLRWMMGVFAIPFGLFIEVNSFKSAILATALTVSVLNSFLPNHIVQRRSYRLLISTIILIGVIASWRSLPGGSYDKIGIIELIWISAAIITGFAFPTMTLRYYFTRSAVKSI